jgi:hypothetical protein
LAYDTNAVSSLPSWIERSGILSPRTATLQLPLEINGILSASTSFSQLADIKDILSGKTTTPLLRYGTSGLLTFTPLLPTVIGVPSSSGTGTTPPKDQH